ncbi:carboxymuconolactone decarboxylase family protein [Streptomyces coeruleoprunus]|uniref:Carboxymuconolactone decarboxylase family protein n=1 Tax=Streptomyces coeruleoprunus TaxID=285563 RepID=A0ABV9XIJ0_9ACTN
MFPAHTLASAPPASRPAMEAVERRMGKLPRAVRRLASSPDLLNSFLQLTAAFDRTTLDPIAREVVVMTVATRNGCGVCVDLHTRKLRGLGADEELITALHAGPDGPPLPDPRLDAIRRFVLAVYATNGAVPEADAAAFLAAGHTERNALEVVMGIGAYTMSTFANRLVRAEA